MTLLIKSSVLISAAENCDLFSSPVAAAAVLSHAIASSWPPYYFRPLPPPASAMLAADARYSMVGTGSASCQPPTPFWGCTPPLDSPTSPTRSCCSATPGGASTMACPRAFGDQICSIVDRQMACGCGFRPSSPTSRSPPRSRSRSRSPLGTRLKDTCGRTSSKPRGQRCPLYPPSSSSWNNTLTFEL
jgi:hypothetical protein